MPGLSGKVITVILALVSRIEVNAYLSQKVVRVGESVTLTVEIKGGNGEVELPDMKDFQVVGSTTSSQVTIINGEVTRSIQYNYTLVPLKEGTLKIPSIPVKTSGGLIYTRPLALRVVSDRSAEKENPPVFVRAEISPDTGYIGQVFTYRLKLYSRVPLKNAGISDAQFDGFVPDESVKDGPIQRSGFEYVNGVRYKVVELVYPLHPLKEGTFKIKGIQIVVEYRTGRKRRDETNPFWDFFEDDFFGSWRRKVLVPKVLQVTVKKLPPPPDGAVFTGLVGTFRGKWSVSSTKAAVGETITLTFTVTGTGNFRNFALPESLTFPGFRAYRDKPSVKVGVTSAGLKGNVKVKFALIPQEPGLKTLMSGLRLVYFDPQMESYVDFPPPQFTLFVKKGKKEGGEIVTFSPVHLKEEVKTQAKDIFDIYTGPEALRVKSLVPPFTVTAFFTLFPPFIALLAFFYRQFQKKSSERELERRKSKAFHNFRRQLNSASTPEEVLSAFIRYVKDKTGLQRGLTAEEAVKVLSREGENSTVERLKKAVMHVERAVYGGGDVDQRIKEELLEAVSKLEKKKKFMMKGMFISFTLVLLFSTPAHSFQTEFYRAAEAYRNGEYQKALTMFLDLYKSGLKNGYVLYNAGNAAYRLGKIGEAILLYRRALFYMPYSGDLIWNLERAREMRRDKINISSYSKVLKVLSEPFSLPLRVSFYVFFIANFLFWAGTALFLFTRFRKGIFTALLIFYVYSLGCLFYGVKQLYIDRDGVVVTHSLRVYSGTDVRSAVLYEIHEGTEVKVKSILNKWYGIELPDGRKGWVKKKGIKVVQEFDSLKIFSEK